MYDELLDTLNTRIPQVEGSAEIAMMIRSMSLDGPRGSMLDHLLTLASLSSVTHVFLNELPDGNALLRLRIDGLVIAARMLPSSSYTDILAEVVDRLNIGSLDNTVLFRDGVIASTDKDAPGRFWLGLLQTSTGPQLTLQALHQGALSTPWEDWPESSRRDIEKMRRHPCGLMLFCSRGWSTSSGMMLKWLCSLATGGGRYAYVTDGPIKTRLPDSISHVRMTGQTESMGAALRALVAQDCDVIALGCRNAKEAVWEAVQTSLEDRLVLANLPSNGVLDTLSWLTSDSGIDSRQVGQVLIGIVGEPRVFRRVCPHCSGHETADPASLATLTANNITTSAEEHWLQSPGCSECNQTGFVPRYGEWLSTVETVYVDSDLARMLLLHPTDAELSKALAERGFRSHFEQGVDIARQGLTTLQEALRIGLARRADL